MPAGPHVQHGSSAEEERSMLAARPALAGDLVDLGPITEPHKRWLLEHATAHLAPSAYEGFGLAPLEAAAAERPCIYAAVTSLREIIDPAAATIAPWDVVASGNAVAPLLRPGPARERHMQLLTAALRRFSWDRVIPSVLEAYELAVSLPYRGAAPRAWADVSREQLIARYAGAYEKLSARVGDGLPLIDTGQPLLTPAEQRGLMRVASRRWLRTPALGMFGLLGRETRHHTGDDNARSRF
jgi:hypothetical protein